MGEWQPIETAPKDGTWVLACAAGFVPAVVAWSDRYGHWSEFDDDDTEANRKGEMLSEWELKYWQPCPESPHD